jgi:hypothetical protein
MLKITKIELAMFIGLCLVCTPLYGAVTAELEASASGSLSSPLTLNFTHYGSASGTEAEDDGGSDQDDSGFSWFLNMLGLDSSSTSSPLIVGEAGASAATQAGPQGIEINAWATPVVSTTASSQGWAVQAIAFEVPDLGLVSADIDYEVIPLLTRSEDEWVTASVDIMLGIGEVPTGQDPTSFDIFELLEEDADLAALFSVSRDKIANWQINLNRPGYDLNDSDSLSVREVFGGGSVGIAWWAMRGQVAADTSAIPAPGALVLVSFGALVIARFRRSWMK